MKKPRRDDQPMLPLLDAAPESPRTPEAPLRRRLPGRRPKAAPPRAPAVPPGRPANFAFEFARIIFLFDDRDRLNLTLLWRAAGANASLKPRVWALHDKPAKFIRDLISAEKGTGSTFWEARRGRGGATWAHWQIAMAYAADLDTELHRIVNEACRRYFKLAAEAEPGPDPGLRSLGKATRRRETDSIRDHGGVDHGPEGNVYADVSLRTCKAVTGMTPWEFRKAHGLKRSQAIRDHFTDAQLVHTRFLEHETREVIEARKPRGNAEIRDASFAVIDLYERTRAGLADLKRAGIDDDPADRRD